MFKTIFLFVLALLNLSTVLGESTNFTEKTIEHCILNYTKEENSEIFYFCQTCEKGYFPFLGNKICLPCNDSEYGQIGCVGNCNASNFLNTHQIICDKEGCEKGYFNFNGTCIRCPGCSNCTYVQSENDIIDSFKCYECENVEYNLTNFGKCEHCSISNCDVCHFVENFTKEECVICKKGYYKSFDGTCSECNETYIEGGGYCKVCHDNNTGSDIKSCYCWYGIFVEELSKCVSCPVGCSECEYNKNTKNVECLNCFPDYANNSKKECVYCGNGCNSCYLDEWNDNHATCYSCESGFILNNSECLSCPDGCNDCYLNEYKNGTICTNCEFNLILTPQNTCIECSNISEIGGPGCYECKYNLNNSHYECLSCWNDDYAFINNTYQCLDNIYSNKSDLYGCIKAIFNEKSNRYECSECKYGFIGPLNDKTCINISQIDLSPGCLEVENIGPFDNPIYSCNLCENNSVLVINLDGIKDCKYKQNNISLCLESNINENGIEYCSKCVENAKLNISNLCECNNISFWKDNSCYRCDDIFYGNPGCNPYKGCDYHNSELYCNECKEGYFRNEEGICKRCLFSIENCGKCHLEEDLVCDYCISSI